MPVVSKNDCWEDKSILALLSAYQECLVTFKSMTPQLVQRARSLTTRSVVSIQRRAGRQAEPHTMIVDSWIELRKFR